MPAGFIIRITTRRPGATESEQELWQVAIDDENLAKEWVRRASNAASDAIAETEKELNASEVAELGLPSGQASTEKLDLQVISDFVVAFRFNPTSAGGR
jgi:hypothetical protein